MRHFRSRNVHVLSATPGGGDRKYIEGSERASNTDPVKQRRRGWKHKSLAGRQTPRDTRGPVEKNFPFSLRLGRAVVKKRYVSG